MKKAVIAATGVVLVAVLAQVLPDIRRYLRIRSM
ncbi:DUF6893 family small protein [Streptomyces sp. NPDC002032]